MVKEDTQFESFLTNIIRLNIKFFHATGNILLFNILK